MTSATKFILTKNIDSVTYYWNSKTKRTKRRGWVPTLEQAQTFQTIGKLRDSFSLLTPAIKKYFNFVEPTNKPWNDKDREYVRKIWKDLYELPDKDYYKIISKDGYQVCTVSLKIEERLTFN